MSDHNDTQEIVLLGMKFDNFAKDLKRSIDDLAKTVDVHSKEIWGTDDSNIGIKAKVTSIVIDRAKEKEDKNRKEKNSLIWRSVIATPVVGLVVDWVVKALHKTP